MCRLLLNRRKPIDEVVLMASGQALEMLPMIINEVKEQVRGLFQYNCRPTQFVIKDKPDMVVISMEVRLSKVQPKDEWYHRHPKLHKILYQWRQMVKYIKKEKGKFYKKQNSSRTATNSTSTTTSSTKFVKR